MRQIFAGLTLLAMALAGSSRAAERFDARFDLYLGGIRAAEILIRTEWEGARFEGRSLLRTVGLAKLIYKGFYRVRAEGRLDGTGLREGLFVADSAFGGKRQQVRVAYRNGRPDIVEADPPFRPKPWQIEPRAQAGTFDPFSAALMLIRPEPAERICNRKVDIFDGRRRTRISLGPPYRAHDGLRCAATYERVGGFSPRTMRKGRTFEFTAVFRVNDAGLAELRQVFGGTDFGVAVARRRG
ncbi:MAG: DUF3108 domain-containing protein [Alphaproteobacteria bacterium]|nr:MAG: DUF3108 domain-containing protein [Alphaproteobacteria bacterium]